MTAHTAALDALIAAVEAGKYRRKNGPPRFTKLWADAKSAGFTKTAWLSQALHDGTLPDKLRALKSQVKPMTDTTTQDHDVIAWFRLWPWESQSGDTLSDEDCQAIHAVILERDALATAYVQLQRSLDAANARAEAAHWAQSKIGGE